jgi:hypothetical protein
MYLRDLAIHLSDLAKLPRSLSRRDFHLGTHAVVERYLDLLPRRSVVLGDLGKLNVTVGPRDEREKRFWHSLGIGYYCWESFDVAAYCAAPRDERQKMLLSILHGSLLRVAHRFKAKTDVFVAAKKAISAQDFPLPEFSQDEMLKRFGLSQKKVRRRPAKARGTTQRRTNRSN